MPPTRAPTAAPPAPRIGTRPRAAARPPLPACRATDPAQAPGSPPWSPSPTDPFAEKQVFVDGPFAKFMIAYFSRKMSAQLDS